MFTETVPTKQAEARAVSRRYIPELDGLRGIAILMVVAFHCSIVLTLVAGPVKQMRALFVPGWTGVDLFLVLSGFLITGILLESKGSPSYFRRFYLRRVLRIFPVYYVALLVCLGLLGSVLIPESLRLWNVYLTYGLHLSNWLSLGGLEIPALNHFWSLALEEQFYLCWPLAVLLLSRKGLGWACLALIVSAPMVRFCLLTFAGGGVGCSSDGLCPHACTHRRAGVWRLHRPVFWPPTLPCLALEVLWFPG